MIVISAKLYADFQEIMMEGFIQRKLDAYAESYPVAYDHVGEAGFREYIESAIRKGEANGLTSEKEIDTILTLMDYLGHEFDNDPQYKWARLSVEDDAEDGAAQRLEAVYGLLGAYFKATSGEDSKQLAVALQKILNVDLKQLTFIEDDHDIAKCLHSLYPDRFKYINSNVTIEQFFRTAREKAFNYGTHSNIGIFLISYMMFMFGSEFDTDQKYQYKFGHEVLAYRTEDFFLGTIKGYFRDILNNIDINK